MKNILFTSLLAALAASGPVAVTRAAPSAAPAAVTLYDGKTLADAGVTAGAWGAGSGQEASDVFLFGGHSIKVTTLDTHQGARLTFAKPVPLAGDARVFQLTLRRGAAALRYDPRTAPGYVDPSGQGPGQYPGQGQYPGGPGGFGGGRGGRGGRGRGGFGRRGGGPNGGGPEAGVPAEAPLIPPITALRLQFTLADGKQADIYRPIPDAPDPLAGEGWYSVNVPVSALKLGGGSPQLKSVTVGGDQYGVFYIGRVRLASNSAAPKLSLAGPQKAFPGQPITLRVVGDSGLSSLQYAWDLGGGQGETPAGATATPRFFTPGEDATVSVTVTDQDGVQPPVTLTTTVHVAETGGGQSPGGPYPGGRGYPGGQSPGREFPGGPGFPGGPPPDGQGNGGSPTDGRGE